MKEFWKDYGKIAIIALVAVIVIGIVIDIVNPTYGWCATVPAGHVGVIEQFGQVRESTLQPGFHMTGFFEHVHPVDIRTQRHNYNTEAFSSDIQQVGLTIAVNENISPDAAYKLYTTVGMNYLENLLEPRLMENSKVVISKYTAESLIANREKLSAEVFPISHSTCLELENVVCILLRGYLHTYFFQYFGEALPIYRRIVYNTLFPVLVY